MLIPLKIPPGFARDGTELMAEGRWRDGSLVRWREGVMQPVGGWSERVDAALPNPPRAALAWVDNTGDRWLALGTSAGLYAISASNAVTDITPSGLVAGTDDATINTGYGGWFYGLGTYGAPRPDTGNYQAATSWTLDNWGQNLVGVSDADTTIYEWGLNVANDAVAVANAPTADSLVVTEERFMFALGASGDKRQIMWSDRENNTVWTPATTNEAGSFILTGGSRIQCGARVRGQTLILTDETAHVATYVGPPFVYGFERVGTACGALSRHAVAVVEGGAFWVGRGGFFRYSGGAAQSVPCEVVNFFLSDLNRSQQSKTYAVTNAEHGEIWWFYPGSDSTECNRYVAFNYREGHWLIGAIDRTCGVDVGTFLTPVWVDPAGVVHAHETGADWGGAEVYAVSGPVNFGENLSTATQMFPDEATQGDVTATFYARNYPNDTEREYGPYPMANPVNIRFTGRQMRIKVTGARAARWVVGTQQLKVQPRGMR